MNWKIKYISTTRLLFESWILSISRKISRPCLSKLTISGTVAPAFLLGKVTPMGWLQLVGSLKLYVSSAEYSLFYRALLQKRPKFLRRLLIVVTPYICVSPSCGLDCDPGFRKENWRHVEAGSRMSLGSSCLILFPWLINSLE